MKASHIEHKLFVRALYTVYLSLFLLIKYSLDAILADKY